MKILIACNHYPVASGRYMMDAFRRLGHEVKTMGDSTGNHIWGTTVDPKYTWQSDIPFGLTSTDKGWNWPDLVVVMDSDPQVWDHVKNSGFECPIVVYGVDNHVRDYENLLFDHYFLAHYHGPTYPVDSSRKDHTWLPCATDTKLFTPSPIPWKDRGYDICMVGVMYPKRVEVLNGLKDAGFKVFASTGLLYDEYRAAYHNSRISLCVSAAGDVAQRIFETGGMGCAILTDPLLDFADEMTNKALHLFGRATYTNPQEAVNLAHELLGHEPQAFQILNTVQPIEGGSLGEQAAREMQRNCLPHTWDARAQVIVNWFEREYGKVEAVEAKPTEILLPFMPGIPDEEKQGYIDAAKVLTTAPTMEEAGELIGQFAAAVNKPIEPRRGRLPFLNLGCGRILLPSERPAHHALIPEHIYQNERWVNIDRVGTVGADQVFDLFTYPWPLESNSFDGALLTHLCEHIPHEIKQSLASNLIKNGMDSVDFDEFYFDRYRELSQLQDGWYAFFAELYRVLTPCAEVHILSPHARSDGAISDPTHTRYLLPDSFSHSMQPNPDAPFEYATGGIHFETVATLYGITPDYMHMTPLASDPPSVQQAKHAQLEHIARTQNNVIPEFYVRLTVVK